MWKAFLAHPATQQHRRAEGIWGQPGEADTGPLRPRRCVVSLSLTPQALGPVPEGGPSPGSHCVLTQGPREQQGTDGEPHSQLLTRDTGPVTPTGSPEPQASASCTCPRGGGSASCEGFALPRWSPSPHLPPRLWVAHQQVGSPLSGRPKADPSAQRIELRGWSSDRGRGVRTPEVQPTIAPWSPLN